MRWATQGNYKTAHLSDQKWKCLLNFFFKLLDPSYKEKRAQSSGGRCSKSEEGKRSKDHFLCGMYHLLASKLLFHLFFRKVELVKGSNRNLPVERRQIVPAMRKKPCMLRDITYEVMIKNPKKIGGPGLNVEIDESKFGKRKYKKGRVVEGSWVFGGICRERPNQTFFVVEPRKDAKTLIPWIKLLNRGRQSSLL